MISGTSPGGPQILRIWIVEGEVLVRGVQLTVTKHQIADLQTAKSRYQIGKQVIEGIEGTWKQELVIESLSSQPGGPSKEGPADIYIYI